VTDIDRAIQQAPKVLPPTLSDWVVGTLTQARCGNRQYGKQFAAELAAEVLSLGESREDVMAKARLAAADAEAREYDAAVASCRGADPVPEATRKDLIFDVHTAVGEAAMEDDMANLAHRLADQFLSRYSIHPRHNPGESK
jgi:hypothetical protein